MEKRIYITPRFAKRILPHISLLGPEEQQEYLSKLERAVSVLKQDFQKNPKQTLWIMESIGLYLYGHRKKNFYLDYQTMHLDAGITLWAMQPPGGGCIHLFQTPEGFLMIDSGYGMNYDDWCQALKDLSIGDFSQVKRLFLTHGDADHFGMAGMMPCATYMHPVTKKMLENGSRGFAAVTANEELVRTYTEYINITSQAKIPENIETSPTKVRGHRGPFPVLDEIDFGGLHFEVWESHGGHLAGQLFFYETHFGLLFTSDCILNPKSITKPRKTFGDIPNYLITSVNINRELARSERKELMDLAASMNTELQKTGTRIRLCCGHGAVSVLDNNGKMDIIDPVHHYSRKSRVCEILSDTGRKIKWYIHRKTV